MALRITTLVMADSGKDRRFNGTDDAWLGDRDPLALALRIDDARSDYCERLEKLIAMQAAEIAELRARLSPGSEGSRSRA